MTAPASVIFDFDGVLADTERLHLRAMQAALSTVGRTLDDAAYFNRYLGFGDRDLVVEFARESGWAIDDRTVAAITSEKADRYRQILAAGGALYPSAPACVRRLGDRFPLAIASGSLHAEIEDILTAGGLREAFRAIVGADDVSSGKPAPEPYLKAASLLGIDPSAAVAVEDSQWGLASARAAGLRTIGITTTYDASALGSADLIVGSLDEISAEVIGALLAGPPGSLHA